MLYSYKKTNKMGAATCLFYAISSLLSNMNSKSLIKALNVVLCGRCTAAHGGLNNFWETSDIKVTHNKSTYIRMLVFITEKSKYTAFTLIIELSETEQVTMDTIIKKAVEIGETSDMKQFNEGRISTAHSAKYLPSPDALRLSSLSGDQPRLNNNTP